MRTVETSILGAPLEELHKRGAAPIFDFFFSGAAKSRVGGVWLGLGIAELKIIE
jgi:hypothetical protein